MSKHNNSLSASMHAKCNCGRYATIGEWKAGIPGIGSYKCPDCMSHERNPVTAEQYYKSMGIKTKQNEKR